MKKGKKQQHKQAGPASSKPGTAPQKALKSHKRTEAAPIDRAARRELRKQEKAQCAVQCKKYIKKVQVCFIAINHSPRLLLKLRHQVQKCYMRNPLQESLLQPSRKHYGGLGYAKESIFVHLDDPEYEERFQEIWDEHVPGFSGKV